MSHLDYYSYVSGLGEVAPGLSYADLISAGITSHADLQAAVQAAQAAPAQPEALPLATPIAATEPALAPSPEPALAPSPSAGTTAPPWGSMDPRAWIRGTEPRGRGWGRRSRRKERKQERREARKAYSSERRARRQQYRDYIQQSCSAEKQAMQAAQTAFSECRSRASAPQPAVAGLGFLPSVSGHTKDKAAAYALGVGTMGVLCGLGIGGKPNTLMLLVGIGSLAYANYQANLVEIRPSAGVQQSAGELRRRIPEAPSAASAFSLF